MRKTGVLKFLFIIAAAVILLQQVFNYIYIRRLDKQYSDIITNKLEVLRSFEFTSSECVNMQRAVIYLVRFNGKRFDSAKNQFDHCVSEIQNQEAKMRGHAVSIDETASVDSLSAMFATYWNKCNGDINIVKSGKMDPKTSALLIAGLRDTYSDLINVQLKESSYFIGNGERVSNEISANTGKTTKLLFFIGILPFIILSLILVLAGFALFFLGFSVNWYRNLE